MALTRDITKTNDHHRKVASNLDHAKQVQKDVLKRKEEMQETLEMHMSYLMNVEKQGQFQGGNMSKEKKKKLPPREFSHKDLDERGVIVESRLPLHIRKNVKFVFSTIDCTDFKVSAKLRMMEVLQVTLNLPKLLAMQEEGRLEIPVEDITLNVNLLINLLNEYFVAKAEKRREKHSVRRDPASQ